MSRDEVSQVPQAPQVPTIPSHPLATRDTPKHRVYFIALCQVWSVFTFVTTCTMFSSGGWDGILINCSSNMRNILLATIICMWIIGVITFLLKEEPTIASFIAFVWWAILSIITTVLYIVNRKYNPTCMNYLKFGQIDSPGNVVVYHIIMTWTLTSGIAVLAAILNWNTRTYRCRSY
jgi:hypothetical protein